MIAEAAYFAAEKHGFNGDPINDWLDAEAQVDARLQEIERERLLERADEVVDAASKRVAALRKELSKLTSSAKSEWHNDVEQLAELRDALREKTKEIRNLGAAASTKIMQQAEKLRQEGIETLHRLSRKSRG
jgi:predicted  nucleic acid-binding Zn-ribbon protein